MKSLLVVILVAVIIAAAAFQLLVLSQSLSILFGKLNVPFGNLLYLGSGILLVFVALIYLLKKFRD